jgi:hypothetical protein
MTPLNDQQRQLLLDYSLGLTCESETAEAERLLASSPEAAELRGLLTSALSPLDSLESEPCPDDLAERTVRRLREQAQADFGRGRLVELLAAEQSGVPTIRVPFFRNWSEVAAVAAVIVLFVGVFFPASGFMRSKYHQVRCGSQLGAIANGLFSYVSDHDGLLPAVAMTPGAPWWTIGYPGEENYSNTRRGWLLVRLLYVEPGRFVCPARRVAHKPDFATLVIEDHNDFPSRAFIHFSIRIGCLDSDERRLEQRQVLMADLNPLSERLPTDHSASLSIELCEELMTSNSRNHNGRGQNLLLSDGSVEYIKVRRASISSDDIYTLQAMSCGSMVYGVEFPSCEKDTFLAP